MNPTSIVDLSIQCRSLSARKEDGEAAGGDCPAGADPTAAEIQRALPPVGNTGGKLTIKVDHLNFTTGAEHVEELKETLSGQFGEPERLGYGFHTYREAYRWGSSLLLCWSPGRAECLCSMNADSIDAIGQRALYELIRGLRCKGWEVRTTRLDTTLDDFSREFLRMEDVHAAAAAGNFTGFRVFDPRQQQARIGGEVRKVSDSIRFGVRGKDGSGCSVIFYDKALESEGEWDSVRCEATWSKEKAHEVGKALWMCSTFEEWAAFLASCVVSSIDFRLRGEETHVDRMPRLDWWERVVALADSFRVCVKRSLPPLLKTVRTAFRQYGKKLAVALVVADSKGQDLLRALRDHLYALAEEMEWKRVGKLDLDLEVPQCFA